MFYDDLDDDYFDENGDCVGGYFSDSEQRNCEARVEILMQLYNANEYWIPLDGKAIKISNLSDRHLTRIPSYLHNLGREVPREIMIELSKRGFTLNKDYSVSGYDQWRPRLK